MRKKKSTQQLVGIESVTDSSVLTAGGELTFYLVQPTNLNVLPESGVRTRVTALLNVLKTSAEVELLALDSKESFQDNRLFYRQRMEQEENSAIRALLAQDRRHLDDVQTMMASSRQFCFVLRRRKTDSAINFTTVEQQLRDSGFTVQRAEGQVLLELLAIYFEQDATHEGIRPCGRSAVADRRNGGMPMKNPFRKKALAPREVFIRTYLDSIAPGVVKFEVDHYIFGNTYRCVWALREYPASTESQAILRHLGEKSGVTLRIYCRQVSPGEEDRIIDNANKKNKLDGSDPNKLRQAVEAESNLRDVAELVHKMHREHEPLLHCAVYLEMTADSMGYLRQLQTDVLSELVRCKLNVDKLLLRQKQGFYCASPVGYNALGREFERVLPAGSVANLYPFNYSGKTDPNGFYIGKDKYGSNIAVDFDRRDSDKTSANILILGNSGQGKSYLMKLLICNLLEAGKSVVSLDAEHELEELCGKLGGCFVDLMAGEKRINVLEVRCWNEDTDMETDESAPEAFHKSTLLARHISFLKDFFRAYKDFSDPQLDTIEIMLSALYKKWGISEETDFRQLKPGDYPVLSDLYALINNELVNYRNSSLYTRELLQEVLLGLHSLCVGADAPFFNGHTNISDDRFLVFGVGGVLTAAKSLRNALLFNVLAYMSDRLLTAGNTVAALDELYLWLSNPVAIEYIRNCLKRVRKRDSALMMASQNLEDFDQEGVREMTKPLFAIPPHQFLFNPGSIGKRFYMDMLQLDEAEFELIQHARRGECLFKCGAERYHLKVKAPPHKAALFGTKGGK